MLSDIGQNPLISDIGQNPLISDIGQNPLISDIGQNPLISDIDPIISKWFNSLTKEDQCKIVNPVIELSYRTCMLISDEKNEIFEEKLNQIASEKEILKTKISVLTLEKLSGFDNIINKMSNLEQSIINNQLKTSSDMMKEQLKLETRLTNNTAVGQIGENFIHDILSNIPELHLQDVTKEAGLGDFFCRLQNVSFIVESKNCKDISVSHLAQFKRDVSGAIKTHNINFGLFVAHRAFYGGLPMTFEIYDGIPILFISDCFNNPYRLISAIFICKTLSISLQKDKNMSKAISQISTIANQIELSKKTCQELGSSIVSMTQNYQTLLKQITESFIFLKDIINPVPLYYKDVLELVRKKLDNEEACTEKTLLKDLEKLLKDIGISLKPATIIKTMGGIQHLRKMALEL